MTCPCCGYCPSCGRGGRRWGRVPYPNVIVQPYVPLTPYRPYYGAVDTAIIQGQNVLVGR